MPAPLVACLLSVALSGVVALLVPNLLRWLPLPPETEDLPPFSELDTPRFRWAVFGVGSTAGCLAALALTPAATWISWVPLASFGALLGLIDLRTTYLPLRLHYLTLALVVPGVGLTAWLMASWQPLLGAAAGGLGATALFWSVWRFSGGRMGFGDVRLAGLIGVVAGSSGVVLLFWSVLLGTAVGAVWAVVVRIRRGAEAEFPYGPALLLGPFLALAVRAAAGGA